MRADPYHPDWQRYNGTEPRAVGADVTTPNFNNINTVIDGDDVSLSLPAGRQSHVLEGQLSGTRATGGHSTNSGSVQIVGEVQVASNGVRQAPVTINDVPKSNNRGVSTLFPEEWSDTRILNEFSEGLSNGASTHPAGGFVTTTPSGVNIRFHRNSSGEITTFFPMFE